MADNTISGQTALTASDITDKSLYSVPVADREGTTSNARMTLREFHFVSGVTYSQNTAPADDSDAGFYSVQQGDDKGLWFSNGAGAAILIVPYASNGAWPVV